MFSFLDEVELDDPLPENQLHSTSLDLNLEEFQIVPNHDYDKRDLRVLTVVCRNRVQKLKESVRKLQKQLIQVKVKMESQKFAFSLLHSMITYRNDIGLPETTLMDDSDKNLLKEVAKFVIVGAEFTLDEALEIFRAFLIEDKLASLKLIEDIGILRTIKMDMMMDLESIKNSILRESWI